MTDRPAPGYTPARGDPKFPDLTLHKLKGLGIKFTKPDKKPFRDRVKPVHNKFIKKGGAPHAEIVDAIKALAN